MRRYRAKKNMLAMYYRLKMPDQTHKQCECAVRGVQNFKDCAHFSEAGCGLLKDRYQEVKELREQLAEKDRRHEQLKMVLNDYIQKYSDMVSQMQKLTASFNNTIL